MSTPTQGELFNAASEANQRLPEATRKAARAELRQLLTEAMAAPTQPVNTEDSDHDR